MFFSKNLYLFEMESILQYFETIPSLHRTLILVGGIAFFWLIEYIAPLFQLEYKKIKHAWPNIFFTLTTAVINLSLAFLLLKTIDWTVRNNFGILQWLDMPLWATVLLGVAGLDLVGAWLAHYVEHRLKPLWRFHIIHHTDTHVDTTTANRHHPGESIIRFVFTIIGVLIFGTSIGIVLLYQSLSIVFSQFNHANIRLPKRIDTMISWVFVSPDMHKVHHHHELPYTDTNYGNIFALWDRIFGTFSQKPNKELVYGIDTHPEMHAETTVGSLLKLPFDPIRSPSSVDHQKEL